MRISFYLLTVIMLLAKTNYTQVKVSATPESSCDGSSVTLSIATPPTDCANYTISNVAFAPLSLTGASSTVSLGDDAVSAVLPIGFDFNFFCTTYSQFKISSNGFITFSSSTASGCCSGQSLPNTSAPNNLIAFAWEDIDPGNGGQPTQNLVRYETTGIAPNRILIVDFFNVDHFPSGNRITVQTLLYESTNIIEIHTTTMPTDGGNHTMGIENAGGTTAFTVAGRNSASWSASNEGKRFTPNSCSAITYDWQSPLGTSIGAGTSIVVNPTTATTYYVVANSSCGSETSSIDIDVLTINAGTDQCTGGGTITLTPVSTFPTSCDNYNITTIPFATQSLSGAATTVSLSDDVVSGALPIGFSFNFFCTDYTQFYISSNGFITFSSGQPNGCCSGQSFPNTTAPNNVIAFAWEDIDPGNGGQPAENVVRYETIGSAPNRILVIEFFNVDHFSNGNNITVQTLLYEANNDIQIQTTTMPTDGGNHTMGIENSGGTIAFTVPGRNSASWSATNEGILISQNNTSTVLWSPASGLSNTTILNPQATPPARTEYTITLNDGNGCVLSDALFVDPSCPLPIELVNFEGTCLNNSIKFYWTTASEIDNDYFTIEKLNENNGKWNAIEVIEGAGTSVEYISYTKEVHNLAEGIYHLKQTDFNGNYDISKNIRIECDNNFKISAYPNPTKEIYTITINDQNFKTATVYISNSFGQTEIKEIMLNNSKTIDVSKLIPGIYNVNITNKYFSHVLKLIIQ